MLNNPRLKIAMAQNGPFVVLLVACAVFTVLNPRFFSLQNFQVVTLSVSEIGIVAMVFALLMMAGGVDLSIGSIASISAVVAGQVMIATDSLVIGIAAGFCVGLLAGVINGLLIAVLGLNPIVATLGALSAWGGLALFLTNGTTVSGLPSSFKKFASFSLGPLPIQILVLATVVGVVWWIRNRSSLGKKILAVGGNERAAHLMGVPVNKTRFLLYAVTGVAAAATGILLSARLDAAPPTLGVGMEVTVLIVVLLGGVAFEGGSGRIGGVVAGLLVFAVLRNGLILIGMSQFVQTILIGATLIVAVALDRTFERVLTRAWQRIGEQDELREEVQKESRRVPVAH